MSRPRGMFPSTRPPISSPSSAWAMTSVPQCPGRGGSHPLAVFLLIGITAVSFVAASPLLQNGSALVLPVPVPTMTPLPTATPTPVPTASPSPQPAVLPPLPPPPSVSSGVFLVLELTESTDRAAVSGAFDLLRRRNLRTLLFVTPQVYPDFLRLAIADGHQVALSLALSPSYGADDVVAQVAAWEALSRRVIGTVGLPLALLPAGLAPDDDLRETLAALGYHLATAESVPDLTPGQVVRVQLGPDTAGQLEALDGALASAGLALIPHWLAAVVRHPTDERAATPEEFRADHIIVVDPGHTRMDVGTGIPVADGSYRSEWWSNVQRAYAIQEMLQEDGWTVVLTHDEEALFDLYADAPDVNLDGVCGRSDDAQFRANFAYYLGLRSGRQPVVISLHVDSSSSPGVRGPVFFYQPAWDPVLQERSRRLALVMQDRVVAAWDGLAVAAPSRGVRVGFPEGYKGRSGTGYDILGTIHVDPAPGANTQPARHYAAVLVEAGTATHAPEGHVLATVEGNRAMAQAHREAVNQWMMTELALAHLAQRPRCPDPASLTSREVASLAAQAVAAGRTEEERVALTFDAGSDAELWPDIRTALAEAGVRPTVFVGGDFIRQHPEVVRQMLADEYDLEVYVDAHLLTQSSVSAVHSEFTRVQEALDAAVGAHVPMCLWRPSRDADDAVARRAAAEQGLLEIARSREGDTGGWREGVTVGQVVARFGAGLEPGRIFAMHVDSRADAAALPAVLEEAGSRGFAVGDVWGVLTEEQIVSTPPNPTLGSSLSSSHTRGEGKGYMRLP